MTFAPTEGKERVVIVDMIRGFALVGVLFANFTSYTEQNVPSSILGALSSPLDSFLLGINAIFLEWKFMTLFAILFGYGFGLILASLAKTTVHPIPFFIRRMAWLFL